MRGLKELRVKESDRLAATAAMLRANGVDVEIEGDDLIVHGKGRAAGRRHRRDPHGPPHRHVGAGDGACERKAGAGRRRRLHRDQLSGLRRLMRALRRLDARFMIIAIDGPAASGKGTLGKRLAAHFGLRHLDTGLLYRAVAKALLDAGHPLDDRGARGRGRPGARSRDIRRAGAQGPRGRRGRLDRVRHPRRARRAVRRSSAISPQRRPARCSTGATSARSICPDADVKIFVTAAPEERARRRATELRQPPANRPTKPQSSPTSCAATSATARAPSRRSSPPPTRIGSTPRSSTSTPLWLRRLRSWSAARRLR